MSKQVVILEPLGVAKEYVEEQLRAAGFEPVWVDGEISVSTPDQVVGLVTVKRKVGETELKQFANVGVIAVAFTGFDAVDLDAARARNVKVYNVPAYSTDSVAELVIGLTISVLRDICVGDREIRAGGWNIGCGNELAGKTVGIVGTGAIGIRTAELFKAFRCKLVGWSRTQREEFTALGGSYVDTLEELFGQVDVVSLHVPSNAHTKGLINAGCLAKMKPSAILVNCARGAVVDQAALTAALNEKKLHAGIDVFEQEPVDGNDAILKTPNSVLTPHVAYKTVEALQRRAKVTVDNLTAFSKGDDTNRVDNK